MAYMASWPKCQTPENPSTRFQPWSSVNQIAPSVATTTQLLLGTMNGNATAASKPTASAIRCGRGHPIVVADHVRALAVGLVVAGVVSVLTAVPPGVCRRYPRGGRRGRRGSPHTTRAAHR